MKKTTIRVMAATGLACLLIAANQAPDMLPDRPIPPMSRQKLLSTPWFALTEERLNFRLLLSEDGTGMFGFQDLDSAVQLHEVTLWRINTTNLFLDLRQSATTPPLKVAGDLSHSDLTLTVSGGGWSRRLTMQNERNVLDRLSRMQRAMKDTKTIR